MLKLTAALLVLTATAWGLSQAAPHAPVHQLTQADKTDFWVLSDTHFIDPALHDQKQAFTAIKQSTAGKDLDYQPVAIRAFVHAALKAKPTAVVITGDITFNGALASAKGLAKRLRPLQKAGIRVLVVPGNHDIYDGWARAFKGQNQLKVAQIGPTDWQRVFPDGYMHATSEDTDSLSYTVDLNNQYQLILLDSCIYPIQASSSNPNTGGVLTPTTLKWLRARLQAAKQAGRTSLVFMHHTLYSHSQMISTGFVLSNADKLRQVLTDYQVPVLFSGHIHAQDVMNDPDNQCPTTEVTSGSFAVSPGSYGKVTVTPTKLTYRMATTDLTPVLTAKERQNKDLTHYQTYLKSLFAGHGGMMAARMLSAQPGVSDADLKAAVKLLDDLNWRYLAGADSPTQAELAKLHASRGYQVCATVPSLKAYVDSQMQDTNVNDRHFTKTIALPDQPN
ncbi:metallophosphoesterase [Lacticaseibacillus daqingensis]|uniref:metallophosphoesterase n=1 Tax=Lacticaseibacillus daqingensis TaxID=2486014 RepID=UPI001CDB6A7A